MEKIYSDLLAAARSASENAYAPYSSFKVGAAVLTEDGKTYVGVNVENSSYGATVCAERNALFGAVAQGERKFSAVAVYSESALPVPCGMCLQVISELAPNAKIILSSVSEQKETTLAELLPAPFMLV